MKPIRKETIRKFGGGILGTVEYDKEGNKQVRDFYGRIVSQYDKSCDVTRDFGGRILTRGDTAIGMLYKNL